MENKSRELEVAIKAALEAGKILEKYFETEIEKEIKDVKEEINIVTKADRESEDVIKNIITSEFPEHSFCGEETGTTENGSEYMWHVDPLDGTRNFANGLSYFAVSISLLHKGEVVVGVVYNPPQKALFYAEKGKGAYWNNKKLTVSKDNAKQCIVTVSSGRKENDLKIRRTLNYTLVTDGVVSSVRDFACTALDLTNVARGSTEADIKFGLKTHDFAAGALMVMEAGGKITKIDGGVWEPSNGYYVASNGIFHDALIEEIKSQKQKLGIE